MAPSNFSYDRLYQTANADAQSVKDSFLIRLDEFNLIMNDIRNNPMTGSVQHYLLLGRRGSGKSTLLRRIQIDVEEDEELKKNFVPVNLAEEQANIFRLFDLLDEIITELEEQEIDVVRPADCDDCNQHTRDLFGAIHNAIEQSGRKVILLLDNIDRVFENLREDAALLREILLNYSDIKVIGGSTRMTEHFWKYDQPFYEFFRTLELPALTSEEVKTLLLDWSERPGMAMLKDFVYNRPGQLETVRILTDGLPRTLQFFVDILVNNVRESGYDYIRQIMDKVTPQYQERLNMLPAAQRKIVLQMAFIWEAAGAKDIATATHMGNNIVSAQLKQLTDKSIVEKVETGTKNHLYRLSERFFNLWLIFTQGNPKEKRRARYLTIFMENFYDGDGLKTLAEKHLQMLREHKLTAANAAMLTKALAQSKHVNSKLRDEMIQYTMEIPDMRAELKEHMPPRITDLANEIDKLTEKKHFAQAIKLANGIEQEDGARELLLGYIYDEWEHMEDAKKYYLNAYSKGSNVSLSRLGILFNKQMNYAEAEKYFLLAIEANDNSALFNLGLLYDKQYNVELAKKYYLLAIEKGDMKVLYNVGLLYDEQKNYELAEQYYLLAIEHGNSKGLNGMGNLRDTQGNYEQAIKYYLLAIEKGDKNASFNLGLLYHKQKNHELAKKYYLLSLDQGNSKALTNVGILYYEEGNYELSINYYLQAIQQGYNEASFNLGLLYHTQKNYEKAEQHYLNAANKGDTNAYLNLGGLYQRFGKIAQAADYFRIALKKDDKRAFFALAFLFYNNGIEKDEALALLQKSNGEDINVMQASILVNAWHGNMQQAEKDLLSLLEHEEYSELDIVLEHLLYHYQVNLVYHLFTASEYANELRERFEPLYYAVGILANKDAKIALKIPPEIKETVDQILSNVEKKRAFYYKSES